MKKLLLITGLALALASCGGKSDKVENQVHDNNEKTNNKIDLISEIEKIVNSANSLNAKLDQEETNVYDILGKCDKNIHEEKNAAHPLGMQLYYPERVSETSSKVDIKQMTPIKRGYDIYGNK